MKLNIQDAINWIDGNLEDEVTLKEISKYIGYSEFHTSRKFKEYTGSTLRRYIILRRLSNAAKDLRDKNVRIIDIAFKYGYNSQEAFTKGFKQAFKITPGEYRRTNKAIPLLFKKDVLFPDNLKEKGDVLMVKDEEILVKLEEVETHKFIYLKRDGVDNYMDFWDLVDKEEGMDCDELHGLLASIKGIYPEGYGAFTTTGYIFGKDAPIDYIIDKKYGFSEVIIPKAKYLTFEHPGFIEAEFGEALNQVRRVALENFDFEMNNYERDESFVKAYEHSGMEICIYKIRIPLKTK